MSIPEEEINNLSVSEKAELYQLLSADPELTKYLFSDKRLFEELDRRDKAFAEGEINLLSRQELSEKLNGRRNGF
ncbi:MAG: hypothetical protein V4722_18685 [Bacteroidota bacterium]